MTVYAKMGRRSRAENNELRPLFGFQMTVRHTTHQIVLVVALTSRR